MMRIIINTRIIIAAIHGGTFKFSGLEGEVGV